MKYDLSVIIPGIRVDRWPEIYQQLISSVGKYSFELICVGPFFPDKTLERSSNFIFLRDFGSPSRCFQMASTLANGEYVMFLSDDGRVEAGAIGEALDLLKSKTQKDGITVLYSEGPNFSGIQDRTPEYWRAHHHDSLKLPLIKDTWKIAPHFIYNLQYFRDLGGLDCSWEHVNMNTHDLAFRIQRDGGVLYPSPRKIASMDWVPWDFNNKGAMQLAYELNDEPLFKKIYGGNVEPEINIDYNNWRKSPILWARRFKV